MDSVTVLRQMQFLAALVKEVFAIKDRDVRQTLVETLVRLGARDYIASNVEPRISNFPDERCPRCRKPFGTEEPILPVQNELLSSSAWVHVGCIIN